MIIVEFFKNYFGFKKSNLNNQESSLQSTPNLSGLTVVQLKEMAKEKGLSGYSRLRKADLIKLLS